MTGSNGFRISTFCHTGGCVAVAPASDGVLVRSSRVADGPVLSFSREEWDAFVAGVRNGEFDVEALRSGVDAGQEPASL